MFFSALPLGGGQLTKGDKTMATKYYLYYVEGEDDKKVVDTLKKDMKLIIPGIARVFNGV